MAALAMRGVSPLVKPFMPCSLHSCRTVALKVGLCPDASLLDTCTCMPFNQTCIAVVSLFVCPQGVHGNCFMHACAWKLFSSHQDYHELQAYATPAHRLDRTYLFLLHDKWRY